MYGELKKERLFTCVFFGFARGAAVVQYVPRFRQRISAKLPSLRVAAANKWRECLRFTEPLLSNYLLAFFKCADCERVNVFLL